MDLQNLRGNYHKLISHMEGYGYSADYVRKIRCEIGRILSNAEAKTWASYRDIYLKYAEKSSNPTHLRDKRTFLCVIENFDVRGRYPDGQQRQQFVQRSKYHLLSNEFKGVIDYYCAAEKARGIRESGIYVKAHNGASFLFDLQQKGIDVLEKITEEAVLTTFVSPEHGLLRGYSCKKSVEAIFMACIPQNPEIFTKILAFLPALRKTRKNIQYLQPEEIIRLRQVLTDEKAPLSYRDKAFGILALYTGLRCGDIAGLTLDAVDWVNDRLRICQKKTSVPLELPLVAVVGNAIFDYIQLERPNTGCEYIFVTSKYSHRRLKDNSVSSIARRIMKAAGIRQAAGDRKGFHIFRHNLATKLLNNDIAQPVISRILGHTSPNSLEVYLNADLKHLKDCALSIEHLPVRKGVLDDA
jgi:integrase